jgi:mannose-6-phosphate isomerase-like protein (cupin superfamily)
MLKITPWGYHKKLYYKKNAIWVKEIFIKEGEATSLQSHKERDEIFFYVSGRGEVILGDEKFKMNPFNKDQLICFKGDKHRLIGGKGGLTIIEVSEGDPKENDIIRYEDNYGRK